jgi:hypothetical protein
MFGTGTRFPRDVNVLKDVDDTDNGQGGCYRKLRRRLARTIVKPVRTTSYRASTLIIGQVNPQVHLEARLYHAIKPVFANGMPMTQWMHCALSLWCCFLVCARPRKCDDPCLHMHLPVELEHAL